MAIVDDVQARLDSYKSDKERTRRLAELHTMSKSTGFLELEFAIEAGALMLRLKGRRMVLTAQQVSDGMFHEACSGTMKVHAEIDGEHVRIPPNVFARSRPN